VPATSFGARLIAAAVSACADMQIHDTENANAARYGTDFIIIGPPNGEGLEAYELKCDSSQG
jgi:hypothetical protein